MTKALVLQQSLACGDLPGAIPQDDILTAIRDKSKQPTGSNLLQFQ
jgi:hypothetical protein